MDILKIVARKLSAAVSALTIVAIAVVFFFYLATALAIVGDRLEILRLQLTALINTGIGDSRN